MLFHLGAKTRLGRTVSGRVSQRHAMQPPSPLSKSAPSGMVAWYQAVAYVTGSQKMVLGARSWRLQGRLELGEGGTGRADGKT